MPKKSDVKKKQKAKGLIRLEKGTVEKAMASFLEDMKKDPEGMRIIEEEEKAVEKVEKEGAK
ncbi:MAG: hypothetical protein ACFFFC_13045 [Candidatus Thorarchaeota archaeon]